MDFSEVKHPFIKGALFVGGVAMGVGILYTATKVANVGMKEFGEYRNERKLEEKALSDPRFENGLTITKFCYDVYK